LNQGPYVVHWNRASELVWDVDVERDFPDPLSRNLLFGTTNARFTRCIVNYEETMSFYRGMIKGDPRREQDLERRAPWHLDAVQRLIEGRTRPSYGVCWTCGSGQSRSRTRSATSARWCGDIGAWARSSASSDSSRSATTWNELNWQEWIPADGETWAALASLSARRVR